jgi:hypothetical protein
MGIKWQWNHQQETSWQEWMKTVPEILHRHDTTKTLHIETSVSNEGWAAMYFEVNEQGEEKILAFRGGLFNPAERKSSTSEREFLAMANSVEGRR